MVGDGSIIVEEGRAQPGVDREETQWADREETLGVRAAAVVTEGDMEGEEDPDRADRSLVSSAGTVLADARLALSVEDPRVDA